MFQPNPPTPRALPDAELNAKIAELQLQPDGLMAAMAFIEEQSKLRQEDALELSKWELAAQMNAATEEPAENNPGLQDTDFRDPADALQLPTATNEPEIDIFAGVPPVSGQPNPLAPDSASSSQAETASPVAGSENIDDIVATLNASYAQVATEPASEELGPDEALVAEPSPVVDTDAEVLPEPVQAPLVFQGQSTPVEPSEKAERSNIENEQAPADAAVGRKTATGAGLSWAWLAIGSTPLALVLAALLKESGASLAQSLFVLGAALVGTSLLASVGSMSAARGQASLTVVSRAAFGVWGNALPATVMLLVKLFWSAALVYFAARVSSPLIFNQPWFASFADGLVFPAELTASLFIFGPLLVISAISAGIGGVVMLRLQQLTAALSIALVAVFAYFVSSTYSLQDLQRGEPIAQASLLDLALLVVAIFTFLVFSLSGDFARKLPSETPGAKVFFLSFVSTFFLPLISGGLGLLWLFMAGDSLGAPLLGDVLPTVAATVPLWVFVIFVVALGISLVHLISVSLYSLSGNLIGFMKIPAWAAQLLLAVAVAGTVLASSYLVPVSSLHESVIELFVIVAVLAAAWSGIIVADALARSRGYHEVSLTREYGFYGKVNLTNIFGFILAIFLGFGYLDGGPQLSAWTGYLSDLTPEIIMIAGSNIGIAMAFGLATLFPIILGIPRIRKQEQNLLELDQRRQELKEFLDGAQ